MYDQLAKNYDFFVDWPKRLEFEIPHLTDLLSRANASLVLDAACGTGMHAIALAREGFQMAGADVSKEMIAQARKNATVANVSLPFFEAGFGRLAKTLETAFPPFSAILCLGNSLPHVLGKNALLAAVADFFAVLADGGVLILQNRNFDAVLAKRDRWMEPQSHASPQGEWIFHRFYDFDADGLLTFNMVTLFKGPGLPWRQHVASTRLWPQRETELRAALGANGFDILDEYGNLDGSSFLPETSPNLIILARKNQQGGMT